MTDTRQPVVRIDVLGRFRVEVDGRTIDDAAWTGRRAVELVQVLAIADERTLLRDQVIDALWPHLDADAGGANLRKAAHHARQALGDPDAVVLRGGTVALFPAAEVDVDLPAFLASAAVALASGDPERCAAAAARYGGELLPGAVYEEWTQQARAHARIVQLRLLRAAERWADVVALDPVDEAAHQQLIRRAIDAGARAEAIRWYGQLRTNLAGELGVAPSPASERLYDECVAGLAATASGAVGRQLELAGVEAYLREVAGRGAGIAVRGPAGIGKTTFCREVARLLEQQGAAVHELDTWAVDRPYGPLVGLVERLALADATLLDAVGEHSRSVLAALTPVAAPAKPLEGPLSRHQVVGAVQRVLRRASAGRRSVVVADDAHRVDDATLEVLSHLATAGPDVLVVLSYRREGQHAALEQGVDRLRDRLLVVDLGPLEASDAARLVRDRATRDLPPVVVDRIVEAAAGNPFVTVELARAADPARPDALGRGAATAIAARLVDLDDDVAAALSRIALADGDVDTSTVVALTGLPEARAYGILDRALDAGVLVVEDGRYRFHHDLVRQALAERLAPHQRNVVHREAAQRLAAAGAPSSTIARHWLAGGAPAEAVPHLLASARAAMEVAAFANVRNHLAPLLAHAPDHHEALRLDAEALDMMGDRRALAAYDKAIATAAPADKHDLVAMRALAQIKQGDPTGALAAIEGATPTSVMGRLSEALTYAGAAALGYGDPALGTAKAAESRRLALQSGDTAAIVIASWAQAAAAHARGELRDSVLADLRDTSQLPHLAVRVFDGQLCIMQRFLYGARPYDDVIAFADGLAEEAIRLGAARGHAYGVTLRGEAELLSGRLDDAEADLHEGARLHRAIGGAVGESFALQRLSEVALANGKHALATSLLTEALDIARATDIGFHLLDRIYGTRITLAQDPDEALAMVDEAAHAVAGPLETCPGCRITFAVPAAIAAAKAGDIERALELQQASEWLAHVVMRLPAWDAAYEEVQGHVALATGDVHRAHTHFAAATAGFAAAGHPLDARRCAELAARHE